jgi:hypothetical protein
MKNCESFTSGALLTIDRPWFPVDKLLSYDSKENTAVVGMKGGEFRKHIAKHHSPSILPLVNDFEHNELSLVLLPLDPPMWPDDVFKYCVLCRIHFREGVVPFLAVNLR